MHLGAFMASNRCLGLQESAEAYQSDSSADKCNVLMHNLYPLPPPPITEDTKSQRESRLGSCQEPRYRTMGRIQGYWCKILRFTVSGFVLAAVCSRDERGPTSHLGKTCTPAMEVRNQTPLFQLVRFNVQGRPALCLKLEALTCGLKLCCCLQRFVLL